MAAVDPKMKIARLENMKPARSVFDGHWEEVRKVTYPTASEFTSQTVRGAKLHKDIFDGSGELAAEQLAAALFGMVTNPATKWFGIAPINRDLLDDEYTAYWCEDSTRRMLSMFNSARTNFAPQQLLKLQNYASFGTGPQFIAEKPNGLPLFQTAALVECYIAENDDGMVDTVYRHYKRTAFQAFARFGQRLPAKIIDMARDPKKMDQTVELLHVVEPRMERDAQMADTLNMKFAEYYICIDGKELLSESGFEENPWVCPRMNPRPGEVYGRGRGMTALADNKMLQRAMKATIRAAEKRTDPPIQVPDDGVMSPLQMTTSGINVVRADLMKFPGGGIRAIETGADPQVGEAFAESIRQRIDAAFWLPILQAFTDPKMTATQVLKLDEQTLRFIGPIIGRLQSEDLGPMIDRVFGIMLRGGQFLPPPPALAGERLEVEYVSPIAKAQRLEEARGLAETFEILAPILGPDDETWDILDKDKAFRLVADLRGVPADVLRPMKAVAERRQGRAEAQRQAQMSEAISNEGPAIAKLMQAAGGLENAQTAGSA